MFRDLENVARLGSQLISTQEVFAKVTADAMVFHMVAVRAYVDTNLFLQFRPLTELDWCTLLGATSIELILKPVVIRELEQKKQGDNKRLRKRAIASLAMITKLLQDDLIGHIRQNVTLHFESVEPDIDFRAHGLSRDVEDDWLLASIIEDAASKPVLVTDDATLLFKSRGKRIRVVPPPEGARLPPEEDEELKNLMEENRALRQRLAKHPELVLTFADRTTVLREEVPPQPHISELEIEKVIQTKRREMLHEAELLTRMRPPDAIRYAVFNETELEAYLAELRGYFHERHFLEDLQRRSAIVELCLLNRGVAPASGIEIILQIPEGVTVGESLELQEHHEPLLPAFFRSDFGDKGRSRIDAIVRASVSVRDGHGWKFRRGGRTLHLAVNKLVHTLSMPLDKFWIAFPVVNGQPRGFNITCSILVASPPDEFSATLNFVPLAVNATATTARR